MKFSSLSPHARVLWAKSGETVFHGVLAHLLDVAAVAEGLLSREPPSSQDWASRAFGIPVEHLPRWIAALAGLHDFGKAIPGFQAKWEPGMLADQAEGLAFSAVSQRVTDHACATVALLRAPLADLSGASLDWVRGAVQAIGAHHGHPYLADEVRQAKPAGESPDWKKAREEILEAYWGVLLPKGVPSLEELGLPAVNWLAGLTSASDWIASNPEWFPLGERCDGLTDYYQESLRLAGLALDSIGWSAASLLPSYGSADELLSKVVGRPGLKARPLQSAGVELLQETKGPALVLIEAPMGEGKTEMAFLAHLLLQSANQHRGLYVALPTHATSNALFGRALTFLKAFAQTPTDVQLVHGGASMNEEVRRLQGVTDANALAIDQFSEGPRLQGVGGTREETLSASGWFSQKKRPLLSRYGVGTIDQALFSVLNVRHHFVRLWGLSNRVVVLDEVHAYDTYTTGIVTALLTWLKAMGSSVVLMSATLPSQRRSELLEAWGAPEEGFDELSYPRMTIVDSVGARSKSFQARELPPIQVSGGGETVEDLVAQAFLKLNGGGCGAVIVNTVARAQEVFCALRDVLGGAVPLLLFHARFPMDDRSRTESTVLNLFGPEGKRPERALLIATQVAEQSLDIDFDFMLSDLAPVDLLLQRAGRLHRHSGRVRPIAHLQAHLWVAGLQEESFPDLKKTAWGVVYDPYILGRTWALLLEESVLRLPQDIDRLVQSVYGDDPLPDSLAPSVRERIECEFYGEFLGKTKKERLESYALCLSPFDDPMGAYAGKPRGTEDGDGLGLKNRTRLGSEGVTLVPVNVRSDGQWEVAGVVFNPAMPATSSVAHLLYQRQVKVSKYSVVQHFKGQPLPESFGGNSLLKNFYPLPLRECKYANGDTFLHLDEVLGLLYHSDEENMKGPE